MIQSPVYLRQPNIYVCARLHFSYRFSVTYMGPYQNTESVRATQRKSTHPHKAYASTNNQCPEAVLVLIMMIPFSVDS